MKIPSCIYEPRITLQEIRRPIWRLVQLPIARRSVRPIMDECRAPGKYSRVVAEESIRPLHCKLWSLRQFRWVLGIWPGKSASRHLASAGMGQTL